MSAAITDEYLSSLEAVKDAAMSLLDRHDSGEECTKEFELLDAALWRLKETNGKGEGK